MKDTIIKPNMDCDAEYFLCSWFDMNRLPKNKMILPAKDICELMEEYHKQKQSSKLKEIRDADIEVWIKEEIKKEPMLGYSRAMMIWAAKAMRDGLIQHIER